MDGANLTKTRRPTVLLAALFLMSAGCTADEELKPCLNLEEVRRFGHDDVVRVGMTDQQIAAGGGVLGQIRGVLAGPDSAVLVLDRYWQKVVAFAPDGRVTQVILGGEGEGPGEFTTPIDMTVTGNGFSVLDYELQRLSEFSWAGEFIGMTRLRSKRPWRHLVRTDTVWIGYSSGGPLEDAAFDRLRVTGDLLESGPLLNEEDRPFGTTAGMAFGPAGEVLITSARPGVWYSHQGTSWVRHGQPLFPEVTPPILEQTGPGQLRLTPSQYTAAGIAAVNDSLVLQGLSWFDEPFDWNSPPARDEIRSALGVFSRAGDHLASLELPPGITGDWLSTDMMSGRIFLTALDPYPQVVEYRLAECAFPAGERLQAGDGPAA